MPRGRFAPSPTGSLHLGNARTALLAWARARTTGATFVVRTEDLDGPRTVHAAVQGNLDELRWLGIDWDEGPDVGGPHAPYVQSQREEVYLAALERLESGGWTSPCWLSRKDLREAASAPHSPPPAYGTRQRRASAAVAALRQTAGATPATRFRVDESQVFVPEIVDGVDPTLVRRSTVEAGGDPVIRRADGTWAYHLAVVVDDAAMEIDEVVRGDDLAPASALHVPLHRALGTHPPTYLHVPLLRGPDGERLSKRGGALSLGDLWSAGSAPARVVGALLWSTGLVDELSPRPVHDVPSLIAEVGAWSTVRRRHRPLTTDVVGWLVEP